MVCSSSHQPVVREIWKVGNRWFVGWVGEGKAKRQGKWERGDHYLNSRREAVEVEWMLTWKRLLKRSSFCKELGVRGFSQERVLSDQ